MRSYAFPVSSRFLNNWNKLKNVKSLPLLSSVTFNNVEDNICFIRFDRIVRSPCYNLNKILDLFIYFLSCRLVLDDHSMLSSCQTWHSVSINIARCCIVSFFIINFFFFRCWTKKSVTSRVSLFLHCVLKR